MGSVNKTALVPYSTREMFELVNDIESYPEFLPWCGAAQLLERTEDEIRARVEIAYGSVRKAFTTRNRLQQDKMIEMRLLEGPFRHLEGYWRFDSLGERACKVALDLDFEFSGRLVGLALGPVFNQIANTLVDAFANRAVEVYGKTE